MCETYIYLFEIEIWDQRTHTCLVWIGCTCCYVESCGHGTETGQVRNFFGLLSTRTVRSHVVWMSRDYLETEGVRERLRETEEVRERESVRERSDWERDWLLSCPFPAGLFIPSLGLFVRLVVLWFSPEPEWVLFYFHAKSQRRWPALDCLDMNHTGNHVERTGFWCFGVLNVRARLHWDLILFWGFSEFWGPFNLWMMLADCWWLWFRAFHGVVKHCGFGVSCWWW